MARPPVVSTSPEQYKPSASAYERRPLPTVPQLLARRQAGLSDDYQLAVCVEGGGMRGTFSAGMCAALQELGATDLIDRVYGTSVGNVAATYLASGTASLDKLEFFAYAAEKGRLIRTRPHPVHGLLDLQWLIQVGMHEHFPPDWELALRGRPKLGVLATRAGWRRADELIGRYQIQTPEQLRWALEGSCRVPVVAGLPLGDNRGGLWDAAPHEIWPMATPMRFGASHLLVLRSAPAERGGESWPRAMLGRALFGLGNTITRSAGVVPYAAQETALALLIDGGRAAQIRPTWRLASEDKQPEQLRQAAEHGRQQMLQWWKQEVAPTRPAALSVGR